MYTIMIMRDEDYPNYGTRIQVNKQELIKIIEGIGIEVMEIRVERD
jgi:hypothetical protein